MSKPVTRGKFTRWCRTCGWKRTYDTAGKADYAKRKHSCQRWQAKAEAHERGEQAKAQVDRTPKPCLHKQADHQHGTRACYVLDRCRCLPCARANADAETWRERQKAYGRYDKYVDAQPVRDHIRALGARGMGWKRVAQAAGVAPSSLWKVLYARRRPDGTEIPPARRITRVNAEKLLAVELDLADGARVEPAVVVAVVNRMRALVALGWSQQKLATRLGIQGSNFHLTRHQRTITARHAAAALALYEQLHMTPPPEDTHRDRIAASRARGYAADRGWYPPLAYDEDDLDSPDPQPNLAAEVSADLDEQAIHRRMNGDRTVELTPREKDELARRWAASGRTKRDMERLTGVWASGPGGHWPAADEEAS